MYSIGCAQSLSHLCCHAVIFYKVFNESIILLTQSVFVYHEFLSTKFFSNINLKLEAQMIRGNNMSSRVIFNPRSSALKDGSSELKQTLGKNNSIKLKLVGID